MALNLLTVNDTLGEYPSSYYTATASQAPLQPTLNDKVSAEVCIIGAGYTGLSAALHLARAGRRVVVLEAHRVGWGASGRNGGQLGTGQRRDQDELEAMLGKSAARDMWTLAEDAKRLVKSLISDLDIDCDYRAGIVHADHKRSYVKESEQYADFLQKEYGYDEISFLDQTSAREIVGSEGYYGGTLDLGAGHLHPLKFAIGLAKAAIEAGVQIYENSFVTEVREGEKAIVKTATGEVHCDTLLFATNGYLGNLGGKATAPCRHRVMPINNFIVVSEPLDGDFADSVLKNDYAVADSRFVVNYFRMVRDAPDKPKRLLFGGGENYGYKFPKDIKAFVKKPMVKVYPQMVPRVIDYGWGGTLAITVPRMPAFQRLSANMYSASGYSGHGVGMATMGGKMLADVVLGDSERFDLFQKVPKMGFPGNSLLRWPLLTAAMTYYAIRDRL
ncbi:MAG: FAD-binding oxidoreductase [Hyphomicrobiales bacterium]